MAGRLVEKRDVKFVVGNNDILVNAVQSNVTLNSEGTSARPPAFTSSIQIWRQAATNSGNYISHWLGLVNTATKRYYRGVEN